MRPARLELEGFTTFRDRTVVDFEGVDLFALTGPTGAGKSSVIDAMIFALYGTVPRFDDARLVGAVVSQGRTEGRVRLDFDVGGERWTAVRVVRVRDGRATTKEARLERDGAVVAGTASELDAAVAALIGLNVHQFTTCVVLPQGQFARFLQSKPADRQGLLVRLLELGLYDALREAAGQRAARLEGELARLRPRLEALAHATPEAVAVEQERVAVLDAVLVAVEARLPDLARVDRHREASTRALADLDAQRNRLDDVRRPDGLDDLEAQAVKARAAEAAAEDGELEALAALDAARAGSEALGERGPLEAWRRAYDEQPEMDARRKDAEAELAEQVRRRGRLAKAWQLAAKASRAAVEAHERAVAENRAAALRLRLVSGERCPVCDQVVDDVPSHDEPPAVGDARRRRDEAAQAEAEADEGRRAADLAVAKAQERLTGVEAARERLADRLTGAPAPESLDAQLGALDAATQRLEVARAAREAAAATRRSAAAARSSAVESEREAWATFDALRDRVAALAPPTVDRRSLSEAWAELTGWAAERCQGLELERAAVEADLGAADRERAAVIAGLDELVGEAGLAAHSRPHRDVVVEARSAAEQSARALDQAVADRRRVEQELAVAERQAQVATALALELRANKFEKWVLDHVLRDLCTSATALLRRLSQEAYSLVLDETRGFMVVDHRNADEVRLARTLSGGETFLASLALALALAEEVARAGRGAARLESLFLDEGFGTLDADTLDVVAAAIEELGASGRMVGLVSHVPELADRAPVRFEVRRGPRSSTIERVDR